MSSRSSHLDFSLSIGLHAEIAYFVSLKKNNIICCLFGESVKLLAIMKDFQNMGTIIFFVLICPKILSQQYKHFNQLE